MVTYQKLAEFDPLKDMRMMGKGKLKSVLECLAKPKEKRHEEEFEILGDLFKNSELQKEHRFEGRELNECLKRL